MGLSSAAKSEMIRTTHEAAKAFVEDLQHMREVLAKSEPTPAEVRRMSNELRRLLIDNGGDIRRVAAPRLDRRIEFLSQDIAPFERAGRSRPWTFLSAGVVDIFGLSLGTMVAEPGEKIEYPADYHPDKTVSLSLDGFLGQKVVCFKGHWICRRDVIKYVANVASGVHSGSPRDMTHELIKKIRYVATVKMTDMPAIVFNPDAAGHSDKPAVIDRNAMDFALLQLMAAARYLSISPDIEELERIVEAE